MLSSVPPLLSYHPLTRNTFRLLANADRFEYQPPIKATSLVFLWLRHAVRGRWAAQGRRISELLSQNIDGMKPVPEMLQPKAHDLYYILHLSRHLYSLGGERLSAHERTCWYPAAPSYAEGLTGVTPRRWRDDPGFLPCMRADSTSIPSFPIMGSHHWSPVAALTLAQTPFISL